MSASTPSSFADATAIAQTSSHTYAAHFRDEWCIGTVPHGGLTTATIHRALTTHFASTLLSFSQPDLLTLHLSFLRRTSRGPALITLCDAKLGRQTSVIHISLTQKDSKGKAREEVVGYAIFTNFDTERGVSFDTAWTLEPPPAPVRIEDLDRAVEAWESKSETEKERDQEVGEWRHNPVPPFPGFRKAALRIHSFYPVVAADPSFADEWIRLRSGEDFSQEALGFVADMWPQLVEQFLTASEPPSSNSVRNADQKPGNSAASKFWYPTLLLNLEVKKRVPRGTKWLFARVRAKQIRNGRYDLEVVILDTKGELVALSQHVALAVDAGRNLAVRDGGKGKEKGKL